MTYSNNLNYLSLLVTYTVEMTDSKHSILLHLDYNCSRKYANIYIYIYNLYELHMYSNLYIVTGKPY
jgi:hypothetical protein